MPLLGLMLLLAAMPAASTAAMIPYKSSDPVLWRWLPHFEVLDAPQKLHLAAYSALTEREMFTVPRGKLILYDPVHHLVLYYLGCCTWQETVLASVSGSPPTRLAVADLSALETPKKIVLGATPNAVRRAYGTAVLHRSTTTPGQLRVLSYYRDQHIAGSGCGWFENFIFRANRLIEIQAGHEC